MNKKIILIITFGIKSILCSEVPNNIDLSHLDNQYADSIEVDRQNLDNLNYINGRLKEFSRLAGKRLKNLELEIKLKNIEINLKNIVIKLKNTEINLKDIEISSKDILLKKSQNLNQKLMVMCALMPVVSVGTYKVVTNNAFLNKLQNKISNMIPARSLKLRPSSFLEKAYRDFKKWYFNFKIEKYLNNLKNKK